MLQSGGPRAVGLAAVLAAVIVSVGACGSDAPQGEFSFENRTSGPLFYGDIRVQKGGGLGVPVDGCATAPFVVRDRDGSEVARIGTWCAGQRWVVRGPGDTDLGAAAGLGSDGER